MEKAYEKRKTLRSCGEKSSEEKMGLSMRARTCRRREEHVVVQRDGGFDSEREYVDVGREGQGRCRSNVKLGGRD